MLERATEKLRRFDWPLLIAVFLLFCLGLAAIYSVNLSQSGANFTDFNKQIIFGGIGFIILIVCGLINYSSWRVYSRTLLVAMFLILLLVLFFGSAIRGTKGWFLFGGFGFQPAELAKVVLIIALAKFFCNRFQRFQVAKHILVSVFFCLVLALPIMLQPDFGSAMILFGIWFTLLILTRLKKKYLILLLLIFVVIAAVGWNFALKDYQRERVLVFLNPTHDPFGSGYNVTQSVIAVGSGGWFGRGLGFGSQSQLKFIPEAQTDFIFAVIAEELGLLGVTIVLGLWAIVFWRLFQIAKKARDDFGLFLVLGASTLFFLHAFINIGMNLGIMPVMGISAPFLSYGGSFLIVSMAFIGFTESVAVHS
ncbi:rod shape-determining protein RodA [Candidatus Falkowbacteria bacterium]|nr:rod shape-determining protein RodA [Candidatus Falkowbacteria bacterium]